MDDFLVSSGKLAATAEVELCPPQCLQALSDLGCQINFTETWECSIFLDYSSRGVVSGRCIVSEGMISALAFF